METDFLVVVHFPLTMRVEVETDLKWPIPPPRNSLLATPPMGGKEVNSTGGERGWSH